MSDGNGNGNGFSKGAGTVVVLIIGALFLWAGATLIEQGKLSERNQVRIDNLEKKSDEIVPRAENERRYSAIEESIRDIKSIIYSSVFNTGKKSDAEALKDEMKSKTP